MPVETGEREGDRAAMDRVASDLVGKHNPETGRRFSPQEAEHAARESMRRVDRDLRNRGER
jgi:hypothetical protein